MSTNPPDDVPCGASSPGEPSARDAAYRQVIAELRESEERYRLLVETAPYAIGVHRRGQLLYCNAHALQILRAASAKDLEGRELLELVHPDDRALAAQRLKAMLERGAVLEPITLRLRTLDGTQLIAEAISRLVQFQGQPAVQTVLRDITEQQRSERQLLASEQRFRELFENSPDAIFVEDLAGRVLDVNPAACKLQGYSRAELLGKQVLDLVPPTARDATAQAFARLVRGELSQVEGFSWTSDERSIPVEIRASRIDFSSQPALLLHVRDMTERKLAEEELRQSESRLRTLLDDLEFVAVQAYDPDGTITFWNKGSEQLYGYAAGEAIGRDIVELLHGDSSRDAERRLMSTALESGKLPAASEVEVLRRDGSRVSILASRILHPRPGQPPEFVCFDVDITARKRADEELALRQTELLHAARLSTVGAMVAALTHEVAQPLSAIGNYAAAGATLLKSLEGEPREKLQEFIDAIQKQTQRCGAILRRLRDFSRRSPPRRSPARLNQVLRDSVEMVSAELRRSEVSVQFDLAEDLPSVLCDRIQIEQVIVNLLTNGRDAVKQQLPDRRTIVVRSRREADEAVFEVADRGEGLAEEAAQRLFEPFFTTKADGMGVGLSICKTILRDHGGRIEALATPGGGATFRVRLPLGA